MGSKSPLANPLQYPLAVLLGAIVWVGGARAIGLSQPVALALGAVVTVAGAQVRQRQEPDTLTLDDPALMQELQTARQQAGLLASRAAELQQSATERLSAAGQVRLLATVQFACDRAQELPSRLEELAGQLQGQDSLFSVAELQRQIAAARGKQDRTQGVARERLDALIASLENNVRLAEQGRDTRQAQAIDLTRLVADSTATLQELQNQLRAADLDDESTVETLQELADKLGDLQENVALLVARDR